MDYWPRATDAEAVLADASLGYVSRYALGRDYHHVLRRRLARLARRLAEAVGSAGYRAFTDSAPVLEKALARDAGLGWIGKHTNLINRGAGSWFFLGEIYTDLPLPVDAAEGEDHCGRCAVCMDVCPTAAIVAPYQLDARRCISYLTIELRGSIPEIFRPLIGNRIYGCDDCQLFCPWNRFARATGEGDFRPRHDLDSSSLLRLFGWSEEEFLRYTEGSAIRRIGYECWLRNLAVALGNAPSRPEILAGLRARAGHPSGLVREHVQWALARHAASSRRG
jgi:epoxyqueuosine reductase